MLSKVYFRDMIERMGKTTRALLVTVLLLALLITLKNFLIPLAYGLLLALIIYPICKKLEDKNVPQWLAILISMLVVFTLLGMIVFIFILQAQTLNKDLPQLTQRINEFFAGAQSWMEVHWGISPDRQHELVSDIGYNFKSNMGKVLKGSFTLAAGTLIFLFIVPLYTVLILAYRKVLVHFIEEVIGNKYNGDLRAILSEVIHSYFNFMKGMFFVYVIVGILNSIGLLALGVDHAILFGMVTAFMTIIPYIGITVSSLLPITVVWAETNNIWYPIGVVAIFSFVQYLEANIIFPYVVGKQIDLNTLVSLIAILLGAAVWGFSGMILFLPFLAFVKVISAHFKGLKPLHTLLEIPRRAVKKK